MKVYRNTHGFTLIELLVAMSLVIGVIIITGSAFSLIVQSSAKLTASEESNIDGVVGLEVFRHDLQQLGYALPSAFSTPLTYTEAGVDPAKALNDAPNNVPRAVVSLNNVSGLFDSSSTSGIRYDILEETDYLAIKAASIGLSNTAKQWTFIQYTSSGASPRVWSVSSDNMTTSSRAIVLGRTYSPTGTLTNTLVYDTTTPTKYWMQFATGTVPPAFDPPSPLTTYYMYGVDDQDLRMPFNRADYFVARPNVSSLIPTTCAPNTGILYKAVTRHADGKADGKLQYVPLLDCVADMQVVFGWDVNNSGTIDESSAYSADSSAISVSSQIGTKQADIQTIMTDPAAISSKLRYIKIYLMVQDGRKDINYVNSNTLVNNTLAVVVGDPDNISLTKGYSAANLSTNRWQNYRWKIYRIVVRPKNLAAG